MVTDCSAISVTNRILRSCWEAIPDKLRTLLWICPICLHPHPSSDIGLISSITPSGGHNKSPSYSRRLKLAPQRRCCQAADVPIVPLFIGSRRVCDKWCLLARTGTGRGEGRGSHAWQTRSVRSPRSVTARVVCVFILKISYVIQCSLVGNYHRE